MNKKTLLVMLVFMFISTSALSQNTIYGTVTGDVQEGVTVQLKQITCGSAFLTDTTTTDSDGYYAFGGLEESRYVLGAELDGYVIVPNKLRVIDIPQSPIKAFDFNVIEYSPADVPVLSKPVVSQTEITTTLGATIDSDGGDPVFERGTVWNITGPPVTENALAEGGTALGAFSHDRPDLMNVPAGTTVYFCGYAENDMGIGYAPVHSFAVKDRLEVKNALTHPARLALGPGDQLYVSDPKVKSIFIYDSSLQLTGELKDLDSPVGVTVDSFGTIYVGNTGAGNVEKYSSEGILLETIGAGSVRMPTDLTLDQDDNLYVADAQSNLIWVFRPDGTLLRTIRKGGLKFPIGVEIAYHDDGTGQMVGELYVADKENYLVKVFDLQGNLQRSFGGMVEKEGMFSTTWNWKEKFLSLQSITMDAQGRLHALDLYMNKIQILDRVTGATMAAAYGEYGTEPGQLKLPLDIIVNSVGKVIVANAENKKVEIIYTVTVP